MKTIAFHNLGCKVNSYEMEVMQQKFIESGYLVVPFDDKADIYLVNTCTVTNIADRKSRQMLHRAKKTNPEAVVVATGCYVQTNPDGAMADESIDLCVGNNRKADIVRIVEEYIESKAVTSIDTVFDINAGAEYEEMTLTSTAERVRAYIKIQDGCNQFCTYCAIPYARGRVRSRKEENILDEIRGLVSAGYKEFVLTGIHISSYGMDFIDKNSGDYLAGSKDVRAIAYEKEYLLNLIRAVALIDGVKRIRLGSLEPRIVTEHFVEELAKIKSVCPHFHLSMQSGCDATLKRMNRHYTTAEYMERVNILRKYYVNPAITTDVITGFPGETEEEFAITEQFVSDVNFYETHIFKYSPRKGTVAAGLKGQNTDAVKSARSDRLEVINNAHKSDYMNAHIGSRVSVLIEEEKPINGKEYMVGHTPDYIMVALPVNGLKVNDICEGVIAGKLNADVMEMLEFEAIIG